MVDDAMMASIKIRRAPTAQVGQQAPGYLDQRSALGLAHTLVPTTAVDHAGVQIDPWFGGTFRPDQTHDHARAGACVEADQ
jgi:hypothetical protein